MRGRRLDTRAIAAQNRADAFGMPGRVSLFPQRWCDVTTLADSTVMDMIKDKEGAAASEE